MNAANISQLNPLYANPTAKNANAVFLPAISRFYTNLFDNAGAHLRNGNLPAAFKGNINALNFLDPDNGMFFYKWALFSAGQAKQFPPLVTKGEDDMIQLRNRETFVVGDSGGYQIVSGAWDVDITNRPVMDKLCGEVLRWQERMADIVMALDVPTGVLLEKTGKPPCEWTFEQLLECSVKNNEFFAKNRNTTLNRPILNVLQGNTWQEQDAWYKAVKDFPFDGWAFPFRAHGTVQRVLEKLLILHHDGKLKEAKWIHFLGLSRLRFAGAMTLLMRFLREHVNPEIVISFDASSPFIAAGTGGGAFHRWEYAENGKVGDVTLPTYHFSNDPEIIGSQTPFPFITSPIGQNIVMGDLYIAGLKGGKTWDALSRMILAAHNVYVHIFAIAELNRMMDTAMEKSFTADLPFQYSDFASCVDKMFKPGTDMKQGRTVLAHHKDVLQWFDRKNEIFVADIASGTARPNWATDDLEEFATYREAP